MIVKCICNSVPVSMKGVMGYESFCRTKFQLSISKEYSVLGVSFGDFGVFLQVVDDYGKCIFVPLCVFDMIDSRPSKYWEFKKISDSDLLLWPSEFLVDYFHDDLSNGDENAISIFKRIVFDIEGEFL